MLCFYFLFATNEKRGNTSYGIAMKCPYCSFKETKVVDKRENETTHATRRRRECLKCKKRFTTHEKAETTPIVVVKKDGRREPFQREKILHGLTRAFEKRPVSNDTIKQIIDDIEIKLRTKGTEVKSTIIGEPVMRKIKSLDKIAYIRFASVYRQFTDVDEFAEELKLLKK